VGALFAAIIGAVTGFMAGVYLAYWLGLHTALHVFSLAIASGSVAAALCLAGIQRIEKRLVRWDKWALQLWLAFLACWALVLFGRMIL
jgi:LytS/YehU family sensor histidine kinase